MQDSPQYTIDDLEALTGIPVRTIRFYVSEGLLPGPGSRGRGALYREEHLLRLQLIKYLVAERIPLAEIARRLSDLSVDELRALLREQSERSVARERAALEASPRAYLAALLEQAREHSRLPERWPPHDEARGPTRTQEETWRRIPVAPGLEIHVRSDVEREYRALIRRLLNAFERSS